VHFFSGIEQALQGFVELRDRLGFQLALRGSEDCSAAKEAVGRGFGTLEGAVQMAS
jgi:hypothetical protein